MSGHDDEDIYKKIPCRKQQIQLLCSLFGSKCSPAIPSVFVYGHTATGKTTTLKLIIEKLHHRLVCINCVECYSPRLLFETILCDLSGGEDGAERCDNMNDFVRSLQLIVKEKFSSGESIYVLLERAERLRDGNANLLPGLLHLQQLSNVNIGVIIESEIVWEKFRTGTGFREPFILHFPDYTKEELIEVMILDMPLVVDRGGEGGCPIEAYRKFVNLLLNIFHLVCHNLNELRFLASVNFKKYMEPVENGDATWEDTRKLWRHIEPHLKKSLQTVYLHEISGVQWEQVQNPSDRNTLLTNSMTGCRTHIELPVYSKYLLIAAYLASYNPAKSDRKFFSKNCGKVHRRSHASLKKTNERTTNQLLGPKVFPVDRLLAIFYSIVDDRVAPSANIFCQIASLATLGLLTQVSGTDALESPKYKCIVSLEFIKSISRSVNFEVVRYIYDFA